MHKSLRVLASYRAELHPAPVLPNLFPASCLGDAADRTARGEEVQAGGLRSVAAQAGALLRLRCRHNLNPTAVLTRPTEFCKWGTWGSERVRDLPKTTKP